jgi:hypothetical protein
MGTKEIGFGERAKVTGGPYEGKIAEIEEYFPGSPGHYFVYVDGVFTSINADLLEKLAR